MKKVLLLPFILAMVFVLQACTDDGGVEESAEESGGENGGEATGDIVIGSADDVVTLDPHGSNDSASSQVRRNIYEPLIFQTVDMELEPGLAEDWEATEDDVWTLTLREGTTFHNGSDFTAEDVKATLDRVRDPAVGSAVTFLFEMIEEVEVVGDHEVNLHTEYPFAPLPSHLAHSTAGIISKELIDEDYQAALDEAGVDMTPEEYYELRESDDDEFEEVADEISEHIGQVLSTETDGTNHLMLESRSAGDEVVTTKFEDYQGGDRNFETVTFRVLPESGARMAELETGGIDIATDVDSSNASRVSEGEDTELVENESVRLNYLGMNVEKEPFDDVRVRQAIAHAIDKEEIIEGVYDGNGVPAEGPLAPDVWGYNEDLEGRSFDLDQARELLDETDVADGFSTTIWISEDQEIRDIALFIQERLGELNIDVEIEQFEWGAYLDILGSGDQDMFIHGWTTVTGDADYGLYALFHTDSIDASGNRTWYSNSELDDLLDEGRTEPDEDVRYDAYTEAQEILVDEVPMSYLFHNNFMIGVNNSTLDGVEVDPSGAVRLDDVTFE